MSTSEIQNRLAMLIGSLMGDYATGSLTVRSTGAEGTIPAGATAYPRGSKDAIDGMLVVPHNPATEDGSWPITEDGELVGVEAVLGGVDGNWPEDTPATWHPPLEGVEAESVVASGGITGGVDLEGWGKLLRFRYLKDFESMDAERAMFAAQAELCPAAILCWQSTVPAGGSVSPNLNDNPNRAGRGKQLYKHEWQLFLVTSRFDQEDLRRREGDELRDNVLRTLTDREAWRGFTLSVPQGIEVLEARLHAMNENVYVDVVRFTTSFTLERSEARTWVKWLRTRMQLQKQDEDLEPENLDVPDASFDMPQDS